jgi:hypothetical protein
MDGTGPVQLDVGLDVCVRFLGPGTDTCRATSACRQAGRQFPRPDRLCLVQSTPLSRSGWLRDLQAKSAQFDRQRTRPRQYSQRHTLRAGGMAAGLERSIGPCRSTVAQCQHQPDYFSILRQWLAGQNLYTDYALDAGYQYLGDGTNIGTAYMLLVHEDQDLKGSFNTGVSSQQQQSEPATHEHDVLLQKTQG